jgi:hypothetical protein
MLVLDTLPFCPSSQVTGSASTACFACHQLSATTATALGSGTTWRTPLRPRILVSSNDLGLPPNTGHWTIAA